MALSTCSELQFRLYDSSPDSDMQEYLSILDELITHVRFIYHKWYDYEAILDSHSDQISSSGYQARSTHSASVGRPTYV